VIDRLEDGDFFGEIALLHSAPRTATVKALDYCDLYTLTKESFDVVVERYPEFAQHMEAVISERFPRTK
jgi:voltage-gated potassium channel